MYEKSLYYILNTLVLQTRHLYKEYITQHYQLTAEEDLLINVTTSNLLT